MLVMIKFEPNKILSAVSLDIKTLPERITKLTEEMGELSAEILSGNNNNMIEEAIDNLMIIVSIHIDLGGNLDSLSKSCTDAVKDINDFKYVIIS